MNIFLLNGPPGSGKDLSGKLLSQMLPGSTAVMKFADPLKFASHAMMALLTSADKVFPPDHFEGPQKDAPCDEIMGAVPRELYIKVSEEVCKPLFGVDVFGRLMVERIKRPEKLVDNVVITDCGFSTEVRCLLDSFRDDRIFLLRFLRVGCSFAGDSRHYLPGDMGFSGLASIDNPGTLSGLRVKLAEFLLTIGE